MEVHQKRSVTRLPSVRKMFRFIEEVKSEFHKIQWTDGEEVVVYAKVVVLATFFLGMAIYFADLVIQRTLSGLEVVFKLLFG
jgi:preprotein translocase subunit SecE